MERRLDDLKRKNVKKPKRTIKGGNTNGINNNISYTNRQDY